MIEFLTLFLGLVAGSQDVAVTVSEQVTKVELRLDGQSVGWLEAPEWKSEIDFGPDLRPRWLDAVAFGEQGQELGNARQAINVPRPAAEASLLVKRDGDDTIGQLIWEDSLGGSLSWTEFSLDSEAYEVEEPERFALPTPRQGRLRLLEADMGFTSGTEASAQTVYGSQPSETIDAELTAIPLRKKSKTSVSELKKHLRGPNGRLNVVGTEREASTLIVVKGDGVTEALLAMDTPFGDPEEHSSHTPIRRSTLTYSTQVSDDAAVAAPNKRWRTLPFPTQQSIALIRPFARKETGKSLSLNLFAASPMISRPKGGLLWFLNTDVAVANLDPTPRVGDALALAGLKASEHNRRRAVLLVLEEELDDSSQSSIASSVNYLNAMGVPVHIWQVDVERKNPNLVHASSVLIQNYRQLRRAYQQLQDDFATQRTAWVSGSYLPSEITISDTAPFTLLADSD